MSVVFLNVLRLVWFYVQSWSMFHVHLRKMCVLMLGVMFCLFFRSVCFTALLKSSVYLFIFCLVLFFFFFPLCLFLRERQTHRGGGEGQREGDTESKAGSRLRAVNTEPDMGLEPTNCEIMT